MYVRDVSGRAFRTMRSMHTIAEELDDDDDDDDGGGGGGGGGGRRRARPLPEWAMRLASAQISAS